MNTSSTRFALASLAFAAATLISEGLTVTRIFSYGDNLSPRRLVEGSDGKFYSITGNGLLVMTPSYKLTVLPITGGLYEGSVLVQGNDGNFYGTTESGGTSGEGSVFKMTPTGVWTTIHSFTGVNPEGSLPNGRLIKGSDGNLYGTTYYGGVNSGYVSGTVFKVTPAGALTTLHSFTGSPDGANPVSPLIEGSPGIFYGTTYSGGFTPLGTVYSVTSSGSYNTLTPFTSYGAAGSWANPTGPVTLASDGNLYGTTPYGPDATAGEDGTIFRCTTGGSLSVVHQFNGSDGTRPTGALIQAKDGYLYGTTPQGGAYGYGTIFRMSLTGSFTTLYSFDGGAKGGSPGSLMMAKNGTFYVTTSVGGNYGLGALIRISTTPAAPEIIVENHAGVELTDGVSTKGFGRVKVGTKGTAQSFTIRNIGTGKLSGMAITLSGPNASDFIVSALPRTALAPLGSTTFKIAFKPTARGTRNAVLHIKNNDANENPFDIKLTGVGKTY